KEIKMMSDSVASMKSGLKAFRRYVPADLVRQMLEAGTEAEPGGKELEITLFFSDVEGFTSISEQIPARDLMLSLSEYLDLMSRTIGREKGTVDKYIGDAVMAIWGAPLSDENHAVGACRAAVRCQQALDGLTRRWQAEGKLPFRTRIGIHTGFTIVGNVGSTERLNYTALGDNVNLASRLEGVNKRYGTRILISQSTYRYVRNQFILRPLDIIAVKGKLSSIMIYELMGDAESEDAEGLAALASGFTQAVDEYRARKWETALSLLKDLERLFPGDVPVSIYAERCRTYLQQEPPADWSGIVRLDTK
ncbi:MAG: adenylate/guanylate cyclase domain-containing protein, partial [Syntrophales bacterium]